MFLGKVIVVSVETPGKVTSDDIGVADRCSPGVTAPLDVVVSEKSNVAMYFSTVEEALNRALL